MFAPPVAKPKTAASSDGKSTLQHSTLFGQRLGDAEQAHMVRPLPKGGASLNAGQDAVPASMRAKDEPPGPAWDFSNIPVLSPGREKPFQMPPLFPAPRLPGPLQAKLKVDAVDDPLEHEADRGAEQVMRMPAPDAPITSTPPQISRKCAACEEEEESFKKSPPGRKPPPARRLASYMRCCACRASRLMKPPGPSSRGSGTTSRVCAFIGMPRLVRSASNSVRSHSRTAFTFISATTCTILPNRHRAGMDTPDSEAKRIKEWCEIVSAPRSCAISASPLLGHQITASVGSAGICAHVPGPTLTRAG
jgi:hypothetical protein